MHVAMHMISRLRPLINRRSHYGGGVNGTQCTVSRCSKLDANLCFVASDPIKVDDVVARRPRRKQTTEEVQVVGNQRK